MTTIPTPEELEARNIGVTNISIIREGVSEVSTATDLRFGEVLVRKGPDATDSTICLTVQEAQLLAEDLMIQIAKIERHQQKTI